MRSGEHAVYTAHLLTSAERAARPELPFEAFAAVMRNLADAHRRAMVSTAEAMRAFGRAFGDQP